MIKTRLGAMIGGAFWTPGCTVIGGQQNLTQLIKTLFSLGEQGFAYDPNDLSTLYQDAAGTIPVTASGQPVGLVLDKSKGLVLGEELASVTEVVSLPIDAVGGVKTYLIGAVDIGKTYQISFTVSNFTGSGDVGIAGPTTQWSDGTSVFVSSNGTKTCIRTKLTTSEVYLYTRNTAACVFSNISIKEIKGNHAYQNTSAARPILQRNATTGAYYLSFDGADDYLIVAKGNLKFLHDGTGANGFVGFKPSGAIVYHTLLNTGNLGSSSYVGYALAQDNRAGNGNIINMVSNGSGTLHVNNSVAVGISANPRVISFKNKLGTHVVRQNGSQIINLSTETGSPSTSASTNDLWIGRAPAGLPFSGNLYGLVCIARLTTDSETIAIEKEIAKLVGVTL